LFTVTLADIPGLDNLAGCPAAEPDFLQRGLDEDSLDVVEVDFATCAVLLFAERTNDKRTLHVHRFD
jgi:hypothetical protein